MPDVVDNTEAERFELQVDGETAFLQYKRENGAISLNHTEVPQRLRGQGIGERLVQGVLDAARAEGLRLVAVCPFVREYLRKHPPA